MKRYLVTGIHPVRGTAPGDEFEADLPPDQEGALVAGGAVRVVVERKQPRKLRAELVGGDLAETEGE